MRLRFLLTYDKICEISYYQVTIVLFSRVFYEAEDLSEFPAHMKECLQTDYRRGRASEFKMDSFNP